MLFKEANHPTEIKQYIAINQSSKFGSISPYIREAEEMVAEFLGEELYDSLISEYTNDSEATPMTPPMVELLPYVQKAIVNYAYYLYISIGSVSLSDGGINVNTATNSDPAPQWKVQKLEMSFLNAGDKALDKLLRFLEQNSETYPDWINSTAFTQLKENILQTALEATRFININGSRRVFLLLKPQINFVEDVYIRQIVCSPLFNQLKDEIKTGALSPDNALLVEKLKPIVAVLALKSSVPQMRLRITDSGIMVTSFSDGATSKVQASDKQVAELIKDLTDKAQQYTDHCKKFLADNLDKYPLFAASECYLAKAVPGPSHIVSNSATSKTFGV